MIKEKKSVPFIKKEISLFEKWARELCVGALGDPRQPGTKVTPALSVCASTATLLQRDTFERGCPLLSLPVTNIDGHSSQNILL